MVPGDEAGPCAQTDQALAELQGSLGPLLSLINGTPPTVLAFPAYNPATGTWSWQPV